MSRSAWYAAFLRSPYWRARRHRVIESRGGCCEICWRSDVKPEVHHMTYARLGDEHENDLALLCRACHAAVHGRWEEVRGLGGDLLVEVTVLYLWRWRNPGLEVSLAEPAAVVTA